MSDKNDDLMIDDTDLFKLMEKEGKKNKEYIDEIINMLKENED